MNTGGVNARSLREHFLSNGFDIVALAEGEETIIQIVEEVSSKKPNFSVASSFDISNAVKTLDCTD